MILAKLAIAKVAPTKIDTFISFHTTSGNSLNSTSSNDKARITETEACEPQFPPVSINIGIKAVKITYVDKAVSKP